MSLNNLEIDKIIKELQKLIIPSKIRKIIEVNPNTFVLNLYHKHSTNLLISLKDNYMRIHISNKTLKQQSNKSNLLLYLKKHIENGIIEDIQQLNNDRIIELIIVKNNITYYLVIEMLEKQQDLLLLNLNKIVMYNLNTKLALIGNIYELPNNSYYIPKSCILKEEDKPYSWTIEEYYDKIIMEQEYKDSFQRIYSYLNKTLKKTFNLLTNLEKQKVQCNKWIDYQQNGELLKSNFLHLKKGLNKLSLINYFDQDQPYIDIDLDPKKDPSENLNHYFKKAKKLKTGLKHIENKLKSTKKEYDKIKAIYDSFKEVSNLSQLDSFLLNYKDDIIIKRLITLQKDVTTKKVKLTSLPYKTFISLTGKRILVGKGGKANDRLTFSIAKGRDIWLHIREYSGSHIVVPLNKDENIDNQTLIDAANLALNYSKAKNNQKGEVIYTKRKNISKRKGSPPGEVQVSVIKTVYIELDKNRIALLKERSKVIE